MPDRGRAHRRVPAPHGQHPADTARPGIPVGPQLPGVLLEMRLRAGGATAVVAARAYGAACAKLAAGDRGSVSVVAGGVAFDAAIGVTR